MPHVHSPCPSLRDVHHNATRTPDNPMGQIYYLIIIHTIPGEQNTAVSKYQWYSQGSTRGCIPLMKPCDTSKSVATKHANRMGFDEKADWLEDGRKVPFSIKLQIHWQDSAKLPRAQRRDSPESSQIKWTEIKRALEITIRELPPFFVGSD